METIKMNGKDYQIQKIRQISAGVMEIAFVGEFPEEWGDFELYTSGVELATTITGYTTVLSVQDNVVQITNGTTDIPVEPGGENEPYFKQLEKMILEMQQSIMELSSAGVYLAKAAIFSAMTFTDEQAIQVPELYPEWSPAGVSYQVGERIRFAGVLYKVLTAHTSQESWTPTDAPSLFTKVLIEDPDIIPDWEQPDSTNPYQKGDKVKHNGKTWESLVDGNVWEPGVTGTENLWKEVTE